MQAIEGFMSLEKRSLYPLTVDYVVFGYDEGMLKIALIERKTDPFKGWYNSRYLP